MVKKKRAQKKIVTCQEAQHSERTMNTYSQVPERFHQTITLPRKDNRHIMTLSTSSNMKHLVCINASVTH